MSHAEIGREGRTVHYDLVCDQCGIVMGDNTDPAVAAASDTHYSLFHVGFLTNLDFCSTECLFYWTLDQHTEELIAQTLERLEPTPAAASTP